MSSNNEPRKRNLPIPEEAIGGAAGVSDKFELNSYHLEVTCERDIEVPSENNTKMLEGNSSQRKGKYDIGLEEGVTIPAKPGGIEIIKKEQDDREI